MSRPVDVITELHLLVDALEAQANILRRTPARRHADDTRWEDHRTESIAAVWETLDRIEPGLGARLMASQSKNGDERYAEWLFEHHAVKVHMEAQGQPANLSTATHLRGPAEAAGCSAFER